MHETATRDSPERRRAGVERVRVRRCARARNPERRRRLATNFVRTLPKPGLHRKVPGLFVFCLPRWRNRNTRMSQKHEVPGSNPGWGTRFIAEATRFRAAPAARRNKRIVLLQLGMWQDQGRHSSTGRARRCQRRGTSSRLVVCPIGSRRLRVRIADLQSADVGSIPAGNARGCSSTDRAFALHANNVGLSPIVSTISFSL